MAHKLVKLAGLAAVLPLGLAACGGSTTGGNTSANPTTGETSASSTGGGSGSSFTPACPSGEILGEGSSAQNNAIQEVIAAYGDACGNAGKVTYSKSGSGDGIKKFIGAQVDWAGTDSALKTEEKDGMVEADEAKKRCDGNDAWNLPMAVGPIAFAYNVQGVDKLIMTPEVLAKIFQGEITTWDDAAIKEINPDAQLSSTKITVFFRNGESGTTENATKFLSKASKGAWKGEPAKAWTGKGEGKDGSDGVAEAVKSTDGGISYMEWSYARDNDLGVSQIDNGGGAVELTGDTVSKAVSEAEIAGKGNDLKLNLKYDLAEEGAYPALLVTYNVTCSKGLDPAKAALVKDFLGFYASPEQQASLVELGYAPLPENIQQKVQTAAAAIA